MIIFAEEKVIILVIYRIKMQGWIDR